MTPQPAASSALVASVVIRYLAAIVILAAFFFLPAGTFAYWHAWVYLAIFLAPSAVVMAYFLRTAPDLLERRLRMREQQTEQRWIIALSALFFLATFLLPGFDFRFGWSAVPVALVIAADGLVMAGYGLITLVLRENRYASRVIEVAPDQTVIRTGPYAWVRHPMYLGALIMYLATPLALGSYWALLPALALPLLLIGRIRNEEAVLARDLPGYREYLGQVRYRLIPGVW